MARKILLADDSVTAQNMGRKILADAGYEVITVNNGSAALKRVTESKPDLIVLDVYMPGYSGLEVCQRLKDAPETAHIPVLLTVGKLEPFKPDEARRARADAHIVKPFEASELLSALARLEDRMVPTDGPRFSTSVAGVERFGSERQRAMPSSDADMGWKSRLRFPSKKKKEEEDEAEEASANFRDFRKGKANAGNSTPGEESRGVRGRGNGTPEPSPATPAGQEPGLVPDIPRDITPEELDALSALAAKLDGPIPAAQQAKTGFAGDPGPQAESITSLAEKVGPPPQPVKSESSGEEEKPVAETVGVKLKSAPVADFEVPAPAGETFAAQSRVESAEAGVAGAGIAGVGIEPSVAESRVGPAAARTAKSDLEAPENGDDNATKVLVSAAAFLETPAPIDQQDEPIFAVAPAAAISGEEAAELKADEASGIAREAVAEEATAQLSHAAQAFAVVGVPPGAEQGKDERSTAEQAVVNESASEAAKTQAEEVATAARAGNVEAETSGATQESAEPEATAPTDEELAEALRLLTPSTGQADAAIPTHGMLVAAGQMLAEEAARTAGPSPRWVAEAVALTQEEISMSLEEEMFRNFSPQTAKGGPSGNPGTQAQPAGNLEAMAVGAANAGDEGMSSSMPMSSQVSGQKTAREPGPPVENVKEAATADGAEESAPGGTFADATLEAKEEAGAVGETKRAEAAQTVAGAESVEGEELSPDVGGEADMGKQVKSSSSKSGWHQIRKPAGTAAARDVVETAKQADTDAEQEDSKAMAAAATAEGGAAGPDASAIASIVDSVLADLRPKIVEEIAKKLGKK